jgi:hypothetical protein
LWESPTLAIARIPAESRTAEQQRDLLSALRARDPTLRELRRQIEQCGAEAESIRWENQRWYVDRQGHTLIMIGGSEEDLATPTERPLPASLSSAWRGASFAIANKEVTLEQFQRFRPEDVPPADPDLPKSAVNWFDAAAYCNWLSEQEGIIKDQWCYLPNTDGMYGPGMRLAPDHLLRTGYRLQTMEEWNFATLAGAGSTWSFGDADDLLARYACYSRNSRGGPLQVGRLKPNDLGLFDVYGNLNEWSQQRVSGTGFIGEYEVFRLCGSARSRESSEHR